MHKGNGQSQQHQVQGDNSSSVLAEKYSSLINKSVTSVGWTQQNGQSASPMIISSPNNAQRQQQQINT
jgi:hypothetical protein